MKTNPWVCILTAGKGTRIGVYGEHVNKALLPLGGKAIISHIIEKFPIETEFVVGTGHLSEQVKQYLSIVHKDRKIVFVDVDNYDRHGSGPGYSLLCCSSFLQKPFYFVSCDTLWNNCFPLMGSDNWLGVSPTKAEETERYCNLKVINGMITELRDKEMIDDPTYQAFVGLCYIKDYNIFWKALESKDRVAGEHQISNGLRTLIQQKAVLAQYIDWVDIGDFEKYKKAVLNFSDYDFSKTNEYFYIVGKKVIKLFIDHSITDLRVKKALLNPGVFPTITDHIGGFYAYTFQAGETLYYRNNPEIFSRFLMWMETEVWKKVNVDKNMMVSACRNFYRTKTIKRLKDYHRKYEIIDRPIYINGRKIPPLNDMLDAVPWEQLEQGISCFIHGDLQFDNILYDQVTKSFKLLDWRQDFDGHIEFGDLYYDLAKLYGGIILNYDYIKKKLISYDEEKDKIFYDFAQRYQSKRYLLILSDYIRNRDLDLDKVKLLVAIVYLNMSPLHHYPFDKLLYALGREILAAELEKLS